MGIALTTNDWATLRTCAILRDLSAADLMALLDERSVRAVDRGQVLFRQGDPAQAFFLVLEGQFKLCRINPGGDEAIVHIYGVGESFAEAAMFLGGRYPVAAEAVTASRILRIESAALRRNVAERPEVAFAMMASMSRHLKVLVDQIERMKLLSADQRVAEFLLDLCGERTGAVTLVLPHEKKLIASRLGMKPATFSRAIARMRELGVEVTGNETQIRDTAKVLAFVNRANED
ncbi:MAG: Crp/Fnr family transcriptional regulator [Magnetospirillum sp.]|jgi:CRP/FNR family transcriptional regulator, dissimilatory nitrate respiration regulator|nr:Crp/Fnr family transcriptional regulator [Magnetospirillum sp.]